MADLEEPNARLNARVQNRAYWVERGRKQHRATYKQLGLDQALGKG